jgi:ABC-type polysaccharide/polyol phosphate transport system ATPase subunit
LSLTEIRGSVDEILAFAELERFANLELRHYSSGMGARLAYSVAFRAVRDVLILDEVFAVGDAGFRRRCEERYRRLHADGHTLVLVSHEPHLIETFCARAMLLERGTVAVAGSGADVAREYARLFPDERRPPASEVADAEAQ